jgi:hypothetical protein
MADWTAPFKLPQWSDEQFEKQKTAYNKKHGYSVTMPAISDIIQLTPFKPLTDRETELWTGKRKPLSAQEQIDLKLAGKPIPSTDLSADMPRIPLTLDEIDTWIKTKTGSPPKTRRPTEAEQKEYKANLKNLIPADRREEIRVEKQRRKDRITSMLASPAPKILRSAGSVMVALDNAQDAIATAGVLGMIAGAVLGPAAAALLAGPVGILGGTAALMSAINPMSYMKWPKGRTAAGRAAKRDLEKFSDKNPFSKKARAKTAAKMAKFRPGFSNLVEALQVTQNIFGIGLCLGPIMGVAQDVLSGVVRQWTGDKVDYKFAPDKYRKEIERPSPAKPVVVAEPPPLMPKHVQNLMRDLKSYNAAFATPWHSDLLEETRLMVAANLSLQVVTPYLQEWSAFDQVENLTDVLVEAPQPTDPLTLEAIEETGHTIDELCNWPQNGERMITAGDLFDATWQQAAENLTHFAQANKNSEVAYAAVQNAHDFALGSIEAIEGPGSVAIEYSHTERIILTILGNNWRYPDDITPAQIQKFEDWVYVHEYMNTQPSGKDIWRYAEVFCGFQWAS